MIPLDRVSLVVGMTGMSQVIEITSAILRFAGAFPARWHALGGASTVDAGHGGARDQPTAIAPPGQSSRGRQTARDQEELPS